MFFTSVYMTMMLHDNISFSSHGRYSRVINRGHRMNECGWRVFFEAIVRGVRYWVLACRAGVRGPVFTINPEHCIVFSVFPRSNQSGFYVFRLESPTIGDGGLAYLNTSHTTVLNCNLLGRFIAKTAYSRYPP